MELRRIGTLFVLGMALLIAACGGNQRASDGGGDGSQEATPSDSQDESESASGDEEESTDQLGRASRETDVVEHGTALDALDQVLDSAVPFIQGDILRVRDGGEGLLDFGDGMQLRLFNDTQIEGVRVEATANAPLDVRLFLEEGGFTGTLTQEGGRAVFETPNGAEITVLGTNFFAAYDKDHSQAYVGNYGGEIEVTGDGETVTLEDGSYLEVPDHHTPGIPWPLEGTMSDFEEAARQGGSTVAVATDLRDASWDMTLDFVGTHEDIFEQVFADAYFDVDAYGEIFGEGVYDIILFDESLPRPCVVTWTGEFEISGQQSAVPVGPSTLDLALSEATLTRTEIEADSEDDVGTDEEVYLPCSNRIASEYPTDIRVESVAFEVSATDGAKAAADVVVEREDAYQSEVAVFIYGNEY
jgi:hypothetical protein